MLLVHQAGSVKVAEVVRYTLTYTPSADRVLPTPRELHVRVRNTSAIALRAAYLHGPYTIHVSAYPSTFKTHEKLDTLRYGSPQFEPFLKAGAHWQAKLLIPDHVRQSGSDAGGNPHSTDPPQSVTWIIEVSSQILFSTTAAVHFELLVAREERSLDIGFAAIAGKGYGEPGRLEDHASRAEPHGKRAKMPKGVYSGAVHLLVEDTAALWNKPPLERRSQQASPETVNALQSSPLVGSSDKSLPTQRQKKAHLVILTHGLHSNIGTDMLYLKESIDSAARQARLDRRKRLQEASKGRKAGGSMGEPEEAVLVDDADEDGEEEEVIVRGFPGNVVRTERGIQYLGKRLAKYVLTTTYPDQPILPPSRSTSKSYIKTHAGSRKSSHYSSEAQFSGQMSPSHMLPYTFTGISFIGHSLGGLVQTYAIAYIRKHSPEFFDRIKPINFICLASPLLGLSNENPLYVKFALDFGLVGRTGRDLGLAWRAPNFAKTGWSAIITGFSAKQEQKEPSVDPRAKPLLRILPSGPAHQVLKSFRNRTVYSNVVNDGIVPLRTSCLLFLDWRSLDRVENYQRENGLIGTLASFGFNEITGASTQSPRAGSPKLSGSDNDESDATPSSDLKERGRGSEVPQPPQNAITDDDAQLQEPSPSQFLSSDQPRLEEVSQASSDQSTPPAKSYNPFDEFLNLFRSNTPTAAQPKQPKPAKVSKRQRRTFNRAQTVRESLNEDVSHHRKLQDASKKRPAATRGDSMINDPTSQPPPKTSVFDAAGDLINPPLPSLSWIVDPSCRSRTIFHDRVYHPEDIPPIPLKKPRLGRSFSSGSAGSRSAPSDASSSQKSPSNEGGISVEEKIARAYHRDLSWRKVLVRLDPDAHNNMIVRRMFSNANGWDVVKHLCDTHFADNLPTLLADKNESGADRAKSVNVPTDEHGEQVTGQTDWRPSHVPRTRSELNEIDDSIEDLRKSKTATSSLTSSNRLPRQDSVVWSDSIFEGSEDEDEEAEVSDFVSKFHKFWSGKMMQSQETSQSPDKTHRQMLNRLNSERGSTRSNSRSKAHSGKSREPSTEGSESSQTDTTNGQKHAASKDKPPEGAERDASSVSEGLRSETASSHTLSASNPAELGLRMPVETRLATGPPSPEQQIRSASSNIPMQVAAMSVLSGQTPDSPSARSTSASK